MIKMIDILNEGNKNGSYDQTRMDISIGLLSNAMKHLTKAVREIESAAQYMDDQEKKDKIEEFKNSLLGDMGTQNSNFNHNYDGADRLINKIDDFIKNNSQNAWNFNLNNNREKKAPTGDYVNGYYPGLEED